jgi:hypothetical protein
MSEFLYINLPVETRGIIAAEQKKERDVILKNKVSARITSYINEFTLGTTNRASEFSVVL